MKMIKLSDGCYVSASQVVEVKVNSAKDFITVRTKDGIGHCHHPEYGESVYAALDRLIAEIMPQLANT